MNREEYVCSILSANCKKEFKQQTVSCTKSWQDICGNEKQLLIDTYVKWNECFDKEIMNSLKNKYIIGLTLQDISQIDCTSGNVIRRIKSTLIGIYCYSTQRFLNCVPMHYLKHFDLDLLKRYNVYNEMQISDAEVFACFLRYAVYPIVTKCRDNLIAFIWCYNNKPVFKIFMLADLNQELPMDMIKDRMPMI